MPPHVKQPTHTARTARHAPGNGGARVLLRAVLLMATVVCVFTFSWAYFRRPARTPLAGQQLAQGVLYSRLVRESPHPLVVHILEVDLANPKVSLLVTPGDTSGGMEFRARTTSEFAREYQAQFAINGGYFDPFETNSPWDFYPQSGDAVNALGLTISNGEVVSGENYSIALCYQAQFASIGYGSCPLGTTQALAGLPLFVENGAWTLADPQVSFAQLEPRTVVALDASGTRLWLLVADGRQSGYSEGATLGELADIVIGLGGWSALNLDGGGSSTMVQSHWWGIQTLNSPIHTRIPTRQRPVATHLGVLVAP